MFKFNSLHLVCKRNWGILEEIIANWLTVKVPSKIIIRTQVQKEFLGFFSVRGMEVFEFTNKHTGNLEC